VFRFLRTCLPLLATLLAPGGAFALTIDFDYTYDTGDFFSGVNIGRRLYLDEAAQLFESHLTDSLAAIAPGGGNTWSNSFFSPATGGLVTLDNVNVPANTLIVYVGARDLGSGVLGEGGPGGYGYDGSPAWADDVKARGQTGALAATPTDFGPWGGSITFSSTASFYFDSDPSTTESFGSENDFFSVALHELGHLLGLGTSPSWKADISASDTFTGTHAEGVFGGAVPLDNGGGHWADGTESTLPFTNTMQAADLDPALLQGTRTYFTNLDYAGLQDIGWNVVNVPEASAGTLLVLAGALFLGTYRARK
jgi:hypothetical protein